MNNKEIIGLFSSPEVTWLDSFWQKGVKQKVGDRDVYISLEMKWNGEQRSDILEYHKMIGV